MERVDDVDFETPHLPNTSLDSTYITVPHSIQIYPTVWKFIVKITHKRPENITHKIIYIKKIYDKILFIVFQPFKTNDQTVLV